MGSRGMVLVSVPIDDGPLGAVLTDYQISSSPLTPDHYHELVERAIRDCFIRSDIAFNSPMLHELDEPLRRASSDTLCPQPPRMTLYSTSSPDHRVRGPCGVDYWVRNMFEPVLLRRAIKTAATDGIKAFVKVSGPLTVFHSITENLRDAGFHDCIVVHTMLSKTPAVKQLMACVDKLHSFGCYVVYMEPGNRA
ncbi:hypothetical protein GGR57DRAFT_508292 [Xylariaceae sp. FL1272]|nr:hypothetical protein GGR57DRAFT_508292 [Xylariaceae sp. FL1272]